MAGNPEDYWPYLHEGYAKFKKLTKSPSNQNTVVRYLDFLTLDTKSAKMATEMVRSNDVAKERLEWLNGPNAEVFYKIWKIRNG